MIIPILTIYLNNREMASYDVWQVIEERRATLELLVLMPLATNQAPLQHREARLTHDHLIVHAVEHGHARPRTT